MLTIPARPVLGWRTFSGSRNASSPCMLDLRHKSYTTSGRAAILLALEALHIGRGDRVLVPTYHCPSMISPLVALGAEPCFYAIGEDGQPLLDSPNRPSLRGVKAALVTHFFGLPQPMAVHRRWCDEHGIALVEDCAHALFGYSDDQPVGTWGDAAIGSLTKFLPVCEGGCLVFNRPGLSLPRLDAASAMINAKAALDMIEMGAKHGRLSGIGALAMVTLKGLRAIRQRRLGVPVIAEPEAGAWTNGDYRIDRTLAHRDISAPCRWTADGAPRDRNARLRRRHFENYAFAFAGRLNLRPLPLALAPHSGPYVFPLWVDEPDPGYAELRRLKAPVLRWNRRWPDVPRIEGDQGAAWSHHVLQLACHQDMTDADRTSVVESMVRVYGAGKADPAPAGAVRSSAFESGS